MAGKHRSNDPTPNPENKKGREPKHGVAPLPQRKGDGSGDKPSKNPKGVKRL